MAQTPPQTPSELETYTALDGQLQFQYPAIWQTAFNNDQIILQNLPPIPGAYPINFNVNVTLPVPAVNFSVIGLDTSPRNILQQAARQSISSGLIAQSMPADAETAQTFSGLSPEQQAAIQAEVDERVAALDIVEFTTQQGYEAARTQYISGTPFTAGGVSFNDAAMMHIVINAPYNHNETAILSIKGLAMTGMQVIDDNDDLILTVANTLQYTPPALDLAQPLPKTYDGPTGPWRYGQLTFNYPADWYAATASGLFLQNQTGQIDPNAPQSGDLQIAVISPVRHMQYVPPTPDSANPNCFFEADLSLTLQDVMQRQIPTTDEQRAQAEVSGLIFLQPESLTIAGQPASLVRIFGPQRESLYLAVDYGQGQFLSFYVATAPGELNQHEQTFFDVVDTIRYEQVMCAGA